MAAEGEGEGLSYNLMAKVTGEGGGCGGEREGRSRQEERKGGLFDEYVCCGQ